jgi:alkanesulfonate monooxygenase SsuD/methylene tetrahydromethanopterin reductase-like flavin-dependent oxidoreductase (luciferase family)
MKFTLLVIPFMRRRGETVPLAGRDRGRFQTMMDAVKDQMVFAEGLGYDGFCLTEHHMQVEGIEATTNPIMWNLYVAMHTKKMRVGQLGMNLTAMNPIKVAEDIAMLDQMTKGRAFAGFSRGNTARWTTTMGQHLSIMSAESDRSEADQRNRRALYENWKIVKSLWMDDLTSYDGEFWKVPVPVPWEFNPTKDWGADAVDENGMLRKVGITPRPYQNPHPPVYAPFSYSMETARFWGGEGAKMVSFVRAEKEEFMPLVIENCLDAASKNGKNLAAKDVLAIGGHLMMGTNPADTKALNEGFDELFNYAYNAPPYNVPMGRLWKGSPQQVLDEVCQLRDKYGVDEFFVWHHVNYFEPEQEMGALQAFADAVISKVN